ncbi:MAG: GxxExxY protein [Chitinophagaceae bacterium]|nr:MAG: GxxExxY protein [Chitinophagaceae bacterium]
MFKNDTSERKELNQLCYEIRGALFEVHKHLGPGLLESIYEEASVIEISSRSLKVKRQMSVPVYYKDQLLETRFRLDLLVEGKVLLELKSVEALHPVDLKKTTNYLRLTDTRIGYLVNFNVTFLEDRKSIIRLLNDF